MTKPLRIIFLGLTLSSSWGNGHAVTYRSLLKALAARGHDILFLECEKPWYASNRDLTDPDYCQLAFYDDPLDLERFAPQVAQADVVVVGSFTPEGVTVGDWAQGTARGVVAFYDIDTPVTLAKLAKRDEEYLAPWQIADYDVYFSFTGGPLLQKLEQDFGAPAACALYCAADPEVYRRAETETRWDLSYLGTYSADRQPALERLLLEPARRAPHLRFAVAGAQYPQDIGWPANVERLEHVPPAQHPAFYSASRFTLNATRADMIAAGYSPSVRLFEAAACRTPVISDVWPGVEEYFEPGREIVLARTSEDVLATLAEPAAAGVGIGANARGRLMAQHTPEHRAATFEREVYAAMQRGRAARGRYGRAVRNLKQKRILVAGGGGFLGSHLCDRLLGSGAEVICVDNFQTGRLQNLQRALRHPRFDVIEADIIEPLEERLSGVKFDQIYNLACAASPPQYQLDPEHTLLTSVLGARNLLHLAERHRARLVFASTSEVYGDPEEHPQRESYRGAVNPTGPRACYDEGKRCAETLAFDFARAGRADVRVARIFNTYGPRLAAADGRVVSNLISQALAGAPLTLFGDGAQTRSFCYVEDLIEGLMALGDHRGAQPGPINIGNPGELSMRALAELILRLTASASAIVMRPLPVDDPRRRCPDITRARDVLGWSPQTPLEEGLRRTISWFKAGERVIADADAEARQAPA
ncbi:MAG TPA: NAD-dependent epimerase/dehydratase family protein [Vitreimonas sp.]|uniref:bifunctional glycosyltransferase/UDP-glucuronate decarboxylase n=1 Tax=Vitreimonas sp. TaxID=3069702 RepID=UPI002D688B40|nr:NAD-dependent epimerase/dehydratase family protein [Vitreimonas sp.]HYD88103.1 NAD-dependent epimerase/dehydratase family protein [Vitreimonas sp.]